MKYSEWLALPLQTRIKIASKYGVEKKGSVEVFNNQVIKDGYDMKEIEEILSHITPDSLAEITGEKVTSSQVGISSLSPIEVAQMNRGYEQRNPGKKAPLVDVVVSTEPKTIDDITKQVNENATTPTLDKVIADNKK